MGGGLGRPRLPEPQHCWGWGELRLSPVPTGVLEPSVPLTASSLGCFLLLPRGPVGL